MMVKLFNKISKKKRHEFKECFGFSSIDNTHSVATSTTIDDLLSCYNVSKELSSTIPFDDAEGSDG